MKAYKRALLTGVCMLWFCFRVMPQLCPSSALAPVFSQDFGQGTSALSTTAAVSGTTNYVFGGVGTDGNYVLSPSFDVSGKADWTKLGDHTGNTFGNMFLVNAGGGKSIFFKQTVNGLCSGSTFNFSAWLANANTSSTIGVCGSGYKYPNVIFNIKNTGGTVLATYNTGNLPLSPVNGPANWQQYGFQFTLPVGTTSLVLEMVDFLGGAAACGNDLALDDILFTACTPQVTIALSTGSTPICSGSSPSISTSLVNSPFTAPAYQWQKSTDNGVTWNNIGTPGTSANDFSFSNISAADGGLYRVLVGPDVASLSSSSCITASSPITVTVNARPLLSVGNNGPLCSGNTLTLTPAITGGTSPYSYTWSGPNSFSSTVSTPGIASVVTAASGTYSLTLTDAQGCVATASSTLSVAATPVVSAISGTNGGCAGTTITLTNSTPAGVWSSSNPAVAAITNSGVVSLLSGGTAVISYSVTSSGCSAAATKTITTARVQLQNDIIVCSGLIQFDQSPFTTVYSGSLGTDSYAWSMTSTTGTVTYDPGSTPASQYPHVQLANGSVYTVALQYTTSGITCSDTQVIYKNIIAADTIQTSHDTTICNSTTLISLAGNVSGVVNAFTWTSSGSGIFSNASGLQTSYTPSVADRTAGNIKLYLTASTNLGTTGSCPPGGPVTDSMILRITPPNTGTNSVQTICSGQALSFTPASSIAASTFSWSSAVITGTATGNALSGTGTITDVLMNPSSSANAVITYIITPSSVVPGGGSCAGTPFAFSVTVSPVAAINAMSVTSCSGLAFAVTPVNGINGIVPAGTTYTWASPAGSGFTGGVSETVAAGQVSGTLMNTTNAVLTATYVVTPLSGSCSGSPFSLIVTVTPVNMINSMTATLCSGSSFNITPVNGFNGIVLPATQYNWSAPVVTGGLTGGTSAANAINISGTLVNPTNDVQTATYTVTPQAGICAGTPFTVTITVNPVATIGVLTATICTGSTFSATPVNGTDGVIPAGTTFSWPAPSLTGGLTGGISGVNTNGISGTFINATNTTQTATYIVTPVSRACPGASFTVSVTVDPVATINQLSAVVCSGTAFGITPTNGIDGVIPAGTNYSWNAPFVTAGINGGNNAIAATSISGILSNGSNNAQTATYVITPFNGVCTGSSFTLTVTVNPVAVVTALTATICSGAAFAVTAVNGANGIIPPVTVFNWSTPSVTGGLSGGTAATNTTSIAGSLINPSNASQTATYFITPLSDNCTGSVFTVTVTVHPVATINPISTTLCSGTLFNFTPANSSNGIVPAGTIYSWMLPSVTGGLTGGMSGSNNLSVVGTLNNPTFAAQTATYIITSLSGSCTGNAFTVIISVDPVAVINAMSGIICSGTGFSLTPVTITNGIVPAGTNYSWGAPAVTGGLTGGTGDANTTSIAGNLANPTNTVQTATYFITPASGGCTGNAFTVTVTVHPVAVINAMSNSICSGAGFSLTPTNGANGIIPAATLYSWSAPAVTGGLAGGISALNTATISGILINNTNTAQTATYLVTPFTGICIGASFSVTVRVDPVAVINTMSTIICSGNLFTVTPTDVMNGMIPAGTKYSWAAPAVSGGLTGGAAATNALTISGTFSNTTSTAQTATYFVSPVSAACTGGPFTVLITVNPLAVVNAMSAIICSGTSFTLTPTNSIDGNIPAGTKYSWPVPVVTCGQTGGQAGTNTANISSTLYNPTNTVQTATYSITPLSGICTGSTFTITVTVDPLAAITAITTVICSGSLFSVTPTNTIHGIVPAGTTYSWSAPSLTIGLTGGASAVNTTAIAGTINNATNTAQTATYTVTPVSGICAGNPFTVTVTVNPVAAVNAMSAVTCSGTAFTLTPSDTINGVIPAGTTYNWATPAVTGSLSGSSAATNVTAVSSSLINTGNTAQTATYTITPLSGSCAASPFTITISVNAVAAINGLTAITCSGIAFAVTPGNADGIVPAGTVYNWAAPFVTSGLTGAVAASGTTNISGILVNTSNIAQTASYSVTPLSGACIGNTFSVIITVSPAATVNPINTVVCSGAAFSITPTDPINGIIPAGTNYSWPSPSLTAGLTGAGSATNTLTISGALINNTNTAQTATYSVTPLSGACTGSVFTVTITAAPVAAVSQFSSVICSGTFFAVTPTNTINGIVPAGTTYNWPTPAVTAGITGGSSTTGSAIISGSLYNTGSNSATATYSVTPVSASCPGNPFTVTVTIDPVAVINAITITTCSGTAFGITPTNGVNGLIPAGTTYSWATPVVTGAITGASGSTNAQGITATLGNIVNTAQTATYTITPVSGACAGNAFSVIVTVNPVTAVNLLTAIACSGSAFGITPVNITDGVVPAGVNYSWTSPLVTGGLTGGVSATGAANISGLLSNPGNTTQTATYHITPANGACTGASFTLIVTINPVAAVTGMSSIICSGSSFSFTPANIVNGIVPVSTYYNWSTPAITSGITGGVTAVNATDISGSLHNTTNTAQTATYSITPATGACNGNSFSITITVNPIAAPSAMTDIVCSGTTFTLTPLNAVNGIIPAGTVYNWAVPVVTGGITGGTSATNATGISGTLINPTNAMQTATYMVTPFAGTCSGIPFTVTVTVNPIATINAMSATLCGGTIFTLTPTDAIDGIIPAGTVYNWSAPAVTGGITGGTSAAAVTNISAVLVNPTNTSQTVTYTVTPVGGFCSGIPFTITVSVTPVAVVSAMTAIVCSGTPFILTPTNAVNGVVPAGISYSWSAPFVTGALTGGTGVINTTSISGTLNNTSNSPNTATYSVTPVTGICVGGWFTVTVTVNPVAAINAMTAVVCSGATFGITPITTVNGIIPAGTIYQWSIPIVTGGLTGGVSAANTIAIAGTLSNPTNATQTAVYGIIPSSGVCTGASFTLTVVVDPMPNITPVNMSVCSGTAFTFTPVNGTYGIVPAATKYSWSIPAASGLTGAGGATNSMFINGTLINATNTTQTATYVITPVSGNCTGNAFTATVTVRPLPKAELTILQTIGCSPFTVNNSIVQPVIYAETNGTYDWFVDNVPAGSGTAFPAFTLSTASAVITLKVTSLYNCGTDATSAVVKTHSSPNPSFTLSNSTGCGPLSVTIANTTPGISAYQYSWTLGNAQYSNLAQPGLISYPASVLGGDTVYTVTLKAYQFCDTFSTSKQVMVSRKANLDFTAALQNTCSPLKVIFTNQSFGKQVQYRISYGDGIDSTTGTNAQYLHTYYAGMQTTYRATLTATNACGIDSLVAPVVTFPNAVNINLTLSDSIVCGNPFVLTMNNRTDSANAFTWDLGDGTAAQTTTAPGNIHHTYQSPGTFLIKNTIAGKCSDTVIYRKLVVHPSVKAVTNILPQDNCIGAPVSFKNISDSTLSSKWIFGDGSVSDSTEVIHSFTQAGTYASKLSVWKTHTGITCSDTAYQPVTIVATKQGRFTLSDSTGKCLPFAVTFVNQHKPAQTKWNWGDGQVSVGDSATHSFNSNGSFGVSMQSVQPGGCSYTDTATVRVLAPEVTLQYKGGAYCQQNNSIEFTAVTNRTDSIRWDFGDGVTIMSAGSQKISHSYSRAGSFIPKLTLLSTGNCNVPVIAQDSIQIDEISAGFKLQAINDCAKTDYRFTDTSRSYFPIVKRLWTMNQNQSTALATPTLEGNQKEINQVYTKAGEYNAALEVQNLIGCRATLDAKFNVAVYEFPKANINSISDACLYNLMEIKSLVVSQDSVIRRIWNLGNGSAATDSVVKIFYNKEGIYTLSLTVGTINSCYDSVYKQLSIHPIPTLVLASDRNVCKGDSIQLKATGATGYIWKDQNDNILCNNCNEFKVTPQKTTQFKVIGYNEFGCSNIISTNVRVIQPFKLDLLASDSMCEGSTRRIIANGADNYAWFPTPGLSNYASAVTYATPAVTTTYKVVGKDGYNCFADTASIKLVIGKPTPVNVGKDTTLIAGVPIQLNTGGFSPDIRQWQWGGKADYSCVYCASPVVKVIDDGPLTVKATNQFGCVTTDTINVKTFCSGAEVFIPNAFTPDGDGVNDVLVLQGRGIKIVKSLRIYSRWGEMVYEKTNFQTGDRSAAWDGKVRGKLANPDVFVYMCEAVCEKGAVYNLKGNVAIIK